MNTSTKKWLRDAAERTGWTLAQAGLGALTVELADLPAVYGVVVAAVLAALKAFVAKHVGDPESASLGGDVTD